jgi:O-antigen biosynthesis protein
MARFPGHHRNSLEMALPPFGCREDIGLMREEAVLDPQQSLESHSARDLDSRPQVRGKFLFVQGRKFYIRGVTYGTFRPDGEGDQYGSAQSVERDFALMAASGINALRTYTPPPVWLLDLAASHNLYVMVGLPWEQHITFLENSRQATDIERRVREAVRACAGHPAILCYTIGNEIPTSIVRWHGAAKVERFLRRLFRAAKDEDPGGLVTYVNFPSTEYLQLPFLDFAAFNVYLETEEKLASYLARLQNLAGDRPLIMAEIGLDSRRNGEQKQAAVLDWQIRAVFAAGCAGAFVFSWTDEWHRGGHDIEDWDFGLTSRSRRPKPALGAVKSAFLEAPFPAELPWPRVSVVVCTYNGARTLAETLKHLQALEYPDYEVIVVNDGSTDATAEIAASYPVRLISIPNGGLSAARNVGMRAATGQIVAHIDDDAYPDPHWLQYLAFTFMSTKHAVAGGPNIAPVDAGDIAHTVANAPGGPIHVLVSDTEAEHVPGCNLAYLKSCSEEIGGFDPQFRVAGDDVDFCWRILQRGWTIGFSPAAMVWHHRRNSIKAYWKQQKGYGRAEGLLERKWPEKYNALGHATWAGRLYGKGLLQTLTYPVSRIYYGTWGTAAFQALYEPKSSTLTALPQVPEWYLAVAALALLSAMGALWGPLLWVIPILGVAVAPPLAQVLASAVRASFPVTKAGFFRLLKLYTVTALLYCFQPIARLLGRFNFGLTPWRRRSAPGLTLPRPRSVSIWSESWRAPEEWLSSVELQVRADRMWVLRGGDFDTWDLEIRGGLAGSIRTRLAVEEHGAGKQLLRFRVRPRLSIFATALFLTFATLTVLALRDSSLFVAAALGFIAILLGVRFLQECGAAKNKLLRAIHDLGRTVE